MKHQQQKILKTLWEKGKLLLKKQLLHFPQCFLLNQIIVSPFVHIFDIMSLVAFELEEPKIGISGKGLNQFPSIVMLGMKGCYISASGVIQSHHGPLVIGISRKIVEKGENAGYQHFLLFPQLFQKVSFSGSLKVQIMW